MTVADIVRRVCGEDVDAAVETELILDNSKIRSLTPEDATFLATFQRLELLGLNSTRLASLENFPHLPTLHTLELADNKLSKVDDMAVLVQQCPNLKCLSLAHNQITSIDILKPLVALTKLEEIDIEENPLFDKETEIAAVRAALFDLLPHLKLVDNVNREGQEFDSGSEEEYEEHPEEGTTGVESSSVVVVEGSPTGEEDKRQAKELLYSFYHKRYREGESAEEEDFNPESASEESEDEISEDDEEENSSPGEPAAPGAPPMKRPLEEAERARKARRTSGDE